LEATDSASELRENELADNTVGFAKQAKGLARGMEYLRLTRHVLERANVC
jgi:hypothetical protein